MRILISSYTLDLSGVPTYTLTLFNELEKRGYKTQIFSPKSGALAGDMNVCTEIHSVERPDVIIGQHRDCVHIMRTIFPKVPMIFSAHGVEPEGEQPPDIEVEAYIAINEEVFGNLVVKGVAASRISIIRDFVDTNRFYATTPVNNVLKNVLFISNRKKWKTYAIIEKACKNLNLNFVAVGSPYGRSYKLEEDINAADLVIGSGRAILEAMSCRRPVINFDKGVGDGYFVDDVYWDSRTYNFCGELCRYKFDVDDLTKEILKYDPEHGILNREIILQEHNVVRGVDRILSIIRRLV